jgi:hypothetical protein
MPQICDMGQTALLPFRREKSEFWADIEHFGDVVVNVLLLFTPTHDLQIAELEGNQAL